MTRRPRAFRLDDPEVVTVPHGDAEPPSVPRGAVVVTEEPLETIEAADGTPVIVNRRRAPWVGILLSALGGLLTLAIGLGLERLIVDLFAAAPWLAWVALGLAALALLAFLAIVAREAVGAFRARRPQRPRAAAIAGAARARACAGGRSPPSRCATIKPRRRSRATSPTSTASGPRRRGAAARS